MPPDQLNWDERGEFTIGSRRDGAVMIGGVTVDLERVRQVLCSHPGVADAAVRPMQPDEGHRLKAFVVPRPEASENIAALLLSLTAHHDATLSVAERPRAFRFGRALPVTPSGKPADWPASEGSREA